MSLPCRIFLPYVFFKGYLTTLSESGSYSAGLINVEHSVERELAGGKEVLGENPPQCLFLQKFEMT
jgi:hypothetical protein